jgi:hypothetical protein
MITAFNAYLLCQQLVRLAAGSFDSPESKSLGTTPGGAAGAAHRLARRSEWRPA